MAKFKPGDIVLVDHKKACGGIEIQLDFDDYGRDFLAKVLFIFSASENGEATPWWELEPLNSNDEVLTHLLKTYFVRENAITRVDLESMTEELFNG